MKVREIELPASKRKVKVRKATLSGMLRRGVLPDRLVAVAMNMPAGGTGFEKAKAGEVRDFFNLLALYVCWAVVEPKVVMEDAKDGELEIDDLDEEDQLFIFNEAKRTLDEKGVPLEFFRLEPSRDGAGRRGEAVLP